MNMLARRALETAGMVVLGDSMLGLARPRAHMKVWKSGPRRWKRAMGRLEARPALVRTLSLGGVALGLALSVLAERGRT